jgi:hypothetical protein
MHMNHILVASDTLERPHQHSPRQGLDRIIFTRYYAVPRGADRAPAQDVSAQWKTRPVKRKAQTRPLHADARTAGMARRRRSGHRSAETGWLEGLYDRRHRFRPWRRAARPPPTAMLRIRLAELQIRHESGRPPRQGCGHHTTGSAGPQTELVQ